MTRSWLQLSGARAARRRTVAGSLVMAVALVLTALAGCSASSGSHAGSGSGASSMPVPQQITLATAKASFGTYLTNDSGRAIYMWEADRTSKTSTCYGDCADDWPPVTVSKHVVAGHGVEKDLVGTVTRKDGTTQVTYGGWPLYYYAPDVKPGQLSGQGNAGFGAVWWVISPDGKPLPSATQK